MTTNDYSAYDIHRLDQAAPDAFADIDRHIGDPAQKQRLTEQGREVYTAELTRDLAASAASPMSLAGWAAVATVRLMEAGKAWEEDTDLAYDQRDAAQAMADELRAELEKVRAQLTAANHRADGLAADVRSLQQANTAYANEVDALRMQVYAQRPVIEAVQAWAEMCEDGGLAPDDCRKTEDALFGAVEQYRVWDLALTAARDEQAVAA